MIPSIPLQIHTSKERLHSLHKREAELTKAIPTLEGHARQNATNDLFRAQFLIGKLTTKLEQLHNAQAAQKEKKEG